MTCGAASGRDPERRCQHDVTGRSPLLYLDLLLIHAPVEGQILCEAFSKTHLTRRTEEIREKIIPLLSWVAKTHPRDQSTGLLSGNPAKNVGIPKNAKADLLARLEVGRGPPLSNMARTPLFSSSRVLGSVCGGGGPSRTCPILVGARPRPRLDAERYLSDAA